jgi:hypothetical protein
VIAVFGWTGGKQLVGASYVDAKTRAGDMKEERKERKEQKKADKRAAREAE